MRLLILLFLLVPASGFARDRGLPRISSGYGPRIDPLHGGRGFHDGIDLPGPMGAPVVAAADGVVRVAGREPGYGQWIELAHPDGSTTRYAHLSRILVTRGARVARGQVIGAMGSTGRSTGSHLHFEVRVAGVAVDPLRYLRAPLVAAAPALVERLAPLAGSVPYRSRFASLRDSARADDPATLPGGDAALGRLSR
jgi:murein DD-endopeptidase MepM/ murein hydrolase activator NlpD